MGKIAGKSGVIEKSVEETDAKKGPLTKLLEQGKLMRERASIVKKHPEMRWTYALADAEAGNITPALRMLKLKKVTINERDTLGRTLVDALVSVAVDGNLGAVRRLVEAGVDAHGQNRFGRNALDAVRDVMERIRHHEETLKKEPDNELAKEMLAGMKPMSMYGDVVRFLVAIKVRSEPTA